MAPLRRFFTGPTPPKQGAGPSHGESHLFRRAKSVIGLDLGSQALKAVEITMDGPEPVITGFARIELPPEGERAEAVAELLSKGEFRSKQVATSVAGQAVVVRYISMVPMSDSELAQAIRFESDKYLPFDPDEVLLDCHRLDSNGSLEGENGEPQMGVVLVACQKGVVHRQLDDLVVNGLSPVVVDVDVFALGNAWELCEGEQARGEEDVATALVDVGSTRTQINVLRGGETCFSREIGIGGSDMTKATARRLGLEPFEAEAIKRDSGDREVEVGRAIAPVIEDLVSELSLSLDFVENREGVRVDEILLSGGGILAPGFVNAVEQGTGRPTRTWNPLDGLRVDASRVDVEELEACASTLAVAIGLASRVRVA
ncbi:Competence protein A [Planctomycetes bacterium Pla86]|uniref:Competence protein A n=1 Tax=Engelhardtia mirabilis TaxID=2528011 RepID=A0A518BP98_9BACT|nr:Competence protein A [Planctomycetes bacterium Pla133]QDV03129.1 Competence protein A [Planctomycetes bacterium Pla86]